MRKSWRGRECVSERVYVLEQWFLTGVCGARECREKLKGWRQFINKRSIYWQIVVRGATKLFYKEGMVPRVKKKAENHCVRGKRDLSHIDLCNEAKMKTK